MVSEMTVINPKKNSLGEYDLKDRDFVTVEEAEHAPMAFIETGMLDENGKVASVGVYLTVEQILELSVKLEHIARDIEGGWGV